MNSSENGSIDSITRYLQLFKGREDYIAQQGTSSYHPIKAELNPLILTRHFDGDLTFGLYVLNSKSQCHLICIDIDIPKGQLAEIDFSDRETKYAELFPLLEKLIKLLIDHFSIPRSSILLEETGGRGYHLWVFLAAPVTGDVAVAFGKTLKNKLDFEIEFFPKQGSLGPKRKLGNLIKLPLGLHQKYGKRSVFFDLADGSPTFCEKLDDSIKMLDKVQPVDPDVLAVATNDYQAEFQIHDESVDELWREEDVRPIFTGTTTELLAGCKAMSAIQGKAEAGKQLSHSEAFHYANTLLSVPGGETYIRKTMAYSFGNNYSEKNTQAEIEQIQPLHPTSCRTLVERGICPAYCKETVEKRNQDPLIRNTTPCSVWLRYKKRKIPQTEIKLSEAASDPRRVEKAFFRLKQYHEHEDSLFYDPFDFESFGEGLENFSSVIAHSFAQDIQMPFSGYLPVAIPKKLDLETKMVFRTMVYSSVYDQVPIQTAIDVIAPNLESRMHKNSYGYRWNLDPTIPMKIFEDWREAYPRFRQDIMSALQLAPDGYHICCDIKGYYDHIDQDILLEQLRNLFTDPVVRDMLTTLLSNYSSEVGLKKGLPQGPAYARLLANFYLNEFDATTADTASGYFRYVDDFFLVYRTEIEAKTGLKQLVLFLDKLGLRLSDDEKKKAVIRPNTDVSDIRRVLDKIQYGILEGSRQIQHLDPKFVNEFYRGLQRLQGTPNDIEQLLKINEDLPSLLFLASNNLVVPQEFREHLMQICRILINRGFFYPKRLKTVFYRLLKIENDIDKFTELFPQMQPSHRVYFLLSLFQLYRSRGNNRDLLINIIHQGYEDDDPFVRGFAIAISAELMKKENWEPKKPKTGVYAPVEMGWFPLVRLVSSYGYLSLSPDQRFEIRKLSPDDINDLLASILIRKMENVPSDYLDQLYVSNLVSHFRTLALPGVLGLLVKATGDSKLFLDLVNFVLSKPSFKSLSVNSLGQMIREKRASVGAAEIENLKFLYKKIEDDELKNAMLTALGSFEETIFYPSSDFAKEHILISDFNGCYQFEHVGCDNEYRYIELLPESRATSSLKCGIDEINQLITHLEESKILPKSDFKYDSAKHEIQLCTYPTNSEEPIEPGSFELNTKMIAVALALAADSFKKGIYFKRKTGKLPLVSLDNLLIDSGTRTVIFKTIGRSFATPHVVSGVLLGEEESDLARMVGSFLLDLFFKNNLKSDEFLKKDKYSPSEAYLAKIISGLTAKEPSHRYSYSRLQYLASTFDKHSHAKKEELAVLYLVERLKSGLFQNNYSKISWYGVCSSLDKHVKDVRTVFSISSLQSVPFKKWTLGDSLFTRRLHSLSNDILNLTIARSRIPGMKEVDPSYLDLVEYLLLYGIVCIESVAMCLSTLKYISFDPQSYHGILAYKKVNIIAAKYTVEIPTLEFASVFTYRADATGTDLKDLSLRQICLLSLLSCGGNLEGNNISISKPNILSSEKFVDIVHACLVHIPSIEKDINDTLGEVFEALRLGDLYIHYVDPDALRESVDVLAKDFKYWRKRIKVTRKIGWADGSKYPQIKCRAFFSKKVRMTNEAAVPNMPLVNRFSPSCYRSSWDTFRSKIITLIIPSVAVYQFLEDLKKGKLFGRRWNYYYTGRLMLVFDVIMLIVFYFLGTLSEYWHDEISAKLLKQVFNTFSVMCSGISFSLLCKLLYDVSFWSTKLKRFIDHIHDEFKKY